MFEFVGVAFTPARNDSEDRPTTQVTNARRVAGQPLENMVILVNCIGKKGKESASAPGVSSYSSLMSFDSVARDIILRAVANKDTSSREPAFL